jgi:CHAT domain-containing protein
LVTSLFEVPDAETRQLMARFYAGLRNGQGKLSALHAAQVEIIRQRRAEHGAAHPFFWASFVLVGDPE